MLLHEGSHLVQRLATIDVDHAEIALDGPAAKEISQQQVTLDVIETGALRIAGAGERALSAACA